MTRWAGYCAPGRKPVAWLQALAIPEHVTSIEETQAITGTDLILIDLDQLDQYTRDLAGKPVETETPDYTELLAQHIRRHGVPGLLPPAVPDEEP